MKGGRVIGLVYGTTTPVTNYEQDLITGALGYVSISGISPGQYAITLNEPGYTIISTDPMLPVVLAPDQNVDAQLIMANNSTNSLIVTVKDSETGSSIPYASVHLYSGSGFDNTQITGEEGKVFFPSNTDPPTALAADVYTLDVTEPNHQNFSQPVTVNGLVQTTASLLPNTP
jgi:hypothetical protein